MKNVIVASISRVSDASYSNNRKNQMKLITWFMVVFKRKERAPLLSFQYIRDKLTIIFLSTTKNNKVGNISVGVMSNS